MTVRVVNLFPACGFRINETINVTTSAKTKGSLKLLHDAIFLQSFRKNIHCEFQQTRYMVQFRTAARNSETKNKIENFSYSIVSIDSSFEENCTSKTSNLYVN